MRIPNHLSYSGFALWEKNPEEYYLKHLAESRPDKTPQERPAAVGSCFDAFAKAALFYAVFGAINPEYSFEALFEAQVEPHNRDWVLDEGRFVFERYQEAGAYQDLLDLLLTASEAPRFEFTITTEIAGVPFTGKPDCRFVTKGGVHVIHDWKVNGYCSKNAVSPAKGYMLCRDGEELVKYTKSHNTAHKSYVAKQFKDLTIDEGYMEDFSESWADQLSLYGWSLGEKIGDQEVVLSIHQVACKPIPDRRPFLRFSEYRARVREPYQQLLLKRYTKAWDHITSGYVLPHLSREDNDMRCRMLDREAVVLQSDGSAKDEFMLDCVRPKFRG